MSSSRKAVLVTGASSGIGAECAIRLASSGYLVYAGVRRLEDADPLVASAKDAVTPIVLDVTDSNQIKSAVSAIAGAQSPLVGLVNNAGVAVGGPLEYLPISEIRSLFEVNVFGLLEVTQACLPLLRAGKGRIVNVGSISGRTVTPLVVPYSMSKFAVEALSDGLRMELADAGISVSVIEPGPVVTPIWSKGRHLLDRLRRDLPEEAFHRYGTGFLLFDRILVRNATRGIPPETVVEAIVHALESPTPKTRYLIGPDAKLRALLARWLPDRAHDALIRFVMSRWARRVAKRA